MNTLRSRRGFSTLELLTVMSIMALMATLFVGGMLMGDDVQIAACKADIATIESVLRMYYQDTGMYPMGGNVGMVRALSYREAGWGNPKLTQHARKEALTQFVVGGNRYIEEVNGNTITVRSLASTAADPKVDPNGMKIVRPVLVMVDPWGLPYVYLSAAEYASPPGHLAVNKNFTYNVGVTVRGTTVGNATAYRVSTGRQGVNPYMNPNTYQIYSFGPDRDQSAWSYDKQKGSSGYTDKQKKLDFIIDKDNITSWADL